MPANYEAFCPAYCYILLLAGRDVIALLGPLLHTTQRARQSPWRCLCSAANPLHPKPRAQQPTLAWTSFRQQLWMAGLHKRDALYLFTVVQGLWRATASPFHKPCQPSELTVFRFNRRTYFCCPQCPEQPTLLLLRLCILAVQLIVPVCAVEHWGRVSHCGRAMTSVGRTCRSLCYVMLRWHCA